MSTHTQKIVLQHQEMLSQIRCCHIFLWKNNKTQLWFEECTLLIFHLSFILKTWIHRHCWDDLPRLKTASYNEGGKVDVIETVLPGDCSILAHGQPK